MNLTLNLTEETQMTLTEKEKALLLDIFDDQYSDGSLDCCPWSWSVVGGSHSRAGVLSALQSKGLVTCQGSGRDATCCFTEAGKAAVGALINTALDEKVAPPAPPQKFRLVVTFGDGRSEITRHLPFEKVKGLMDEAFAVAKVSGLAVSFYAEAD